MSGGLDARFTSVLGSGFRLDLSLSIDAGQTIALLGPNGAGKSTAVEALAGLIPIDDGWIRLGDRVLEDVSVGIRVPAEARGIGVVFQDYVLFPHLSVVDNVAFGLIAQGLPRAEVRSRAIAALDEFDLVDLADRRPDDLSGGQAQLVALARALVTDPALLLLDEPLAALDVTTKASLRRMLADHLSEFAGPRLLITHDPTEAFLLADEVCVIEDGVITQRGTPEDIRLRPRTPYAADLAGSNLLVGSAANGTITVGQQRLAVADTSATGPVLATIHPRAISLFRREPDGSPRNTWETRITRIEHYGDRVRIQVGEPLSMTAEVTPQAVAALQLKAGEQVWLSIKATEVVVAHS
jgi:molybdate transport system ATP-binding protein